MRSERGAVGSQSSGKRAALNTNVVTATTFLLTEKQVKTVTESKTFLSYLFQLHLTLV